MKYAAFLNHGIKQQLGEVHPVLCLPQFRQITPGFSDVHGPRRVADVIRFGVRKNVNRCGHPVRIVVETLGKHFRRPGARESCLPDVPDRQAAVTAAGVRKHAHLAPQDIFQFLFAGDHFARHHFFRAVGQDKVRKTVAPNLKSFALERPHLVAAQRARAMMPRDRNVKRARQLACMEQFSELQVTSVTIVPTGRYDTRQQTFSLGRRDPELRRSRIVCCHHALAPTGATGLCPFKCSKKIQLTEVPYRYICPLSSWTLEDAHLAPSHALSVCAASIHSKYLPLCDPRWNVLSVKRLFQEVKTESSNDEDFIIPAAIPVFCVTILLST